MTHKTSSHSSSSHSNSSDSNSRIRTATIGAGYLGHFHAQKYAAIACSDLVAICDLNPHVAAKVSQELKTACYTDYQHLIGKVDAVSIATPTDTHFEIASFFLENKVDVLLEKPMTHTVEQAQQLVTLAEKNNCILQIGHIEQYNSAIVALRPLLKNPRYIESTRYAPFKARGTDVNVVFDMMIHDIDIIQSLVNCDIKKISANGVSVLSPLIDISNARLEFANGTIANVTASRASLQSERSLHLFQHDAYLSLDLKNKLMAQFHKVRRANEPAITDIVREEKNLSQNDALHDQIADFLQKVMTRSKPLVSGREGLRALNTAIEITKIMRQSDDWNYHAELEPKAKPLTSEVT